MGKIVGKQVIGFPTEIVEVRKRLEITEVAGRRPDEDPVEFSTLPYD